MQFITIIEIVNAQYCDPEATRTDCGAVGTTQADCENSGCCWSPIYNNPENLPWCYYKSNAGIECREATKLDSSWLEVAEKMRSSGIKLPFYNPSRWDPGMGGIFATWAPHATNVWLSVQNGKTTKMTLCQGGYYAVIDSSVLPGDEYNFIIEYNSSNLTKIDPFTRELQLSSSSSGDYQAAIVSDPTPFDWGNVTTFNGPSQLDTVIYEMHIPTFNPQCSSCQGTGTFEEAIAMMDYLQHLGVSALEPLPVVAYPGSPGGWGYNPGAPFAIEMQLGGWTNFKEFVKAANERGMAVYMDIVWNHMDPSGGIIWQYDGYSYTESGYNGGSSPQGGIYYYANENAESPWGPRVNYGSLDVRDYIIGSVVSQLNELHISGFRWDSTICIRKGGNACWEETDQNADGVTLLQEANNVIHSFFDGFSIAEDLQDDADVTTPTSQNGLGFDAQWSDTTWYNLQDLLVSQSDSSRSISQFQQTLESNWCSSGCMTPSMRVQYSENHDKSSGQNAGQGRWPLMVDSADPTSYIAQKLSSLALASTLLMPGVPMIFYGQEFYMTENFEYPNPPNLVWSNVGNFTNGTWNSIGAWNGWFNMTRDLIRLRRNMDGVSAGLASYDINVYYTYQSDLTLAMTRGSNQDVVVLFNLSKTSYSSGFLLGVPSSGTWYIRFNSDLKQYSSAFGNAGDGVSQLTTSNSPRNGFQYELNIPLGAYSVVVLSQ